MKRAALLLAVACAACTRARNPPPIPPAVSAPPAAAPSPARSEPPLSLPDAIETFSSGPLSREPSFVRRTYTRGPGRITVTAARTPMSAAQYDDWVRMSVASYPQATLDVPARSANGFYQCTGARCDLLIQLRTGLHVEIRGDGTAAREDVDAVARGLHLGALAAGRTVSFRRDVFPALEHSCTANGSCHGEHGTRKVKLDFHEATAALASLVDRPCRDRPGWPLVSPGHPARSFLVDKMTGPLSGNEGAVMPLDPDTGAPFAQSPLAAWVWETLVPWIALGAPDD